MQYFIKKQLKNDDEMEKKWKQNGESTALIKKKKKKNVPHTRKHNEKKN